MTPEIAVGIPYIALRSYQRYRKVPNLDISRNDMVVQRILMILSIELNTTVPDILSSSRKMPEKDARHLAIHMIKARTKVSLVKLGELFNRDHSTVINSLQKVDAWVKYNDKFRQLYKKIDALI